MKAAKVKARTKKSVAPFLGKLIKKNYDPDNLVTLYIRSFDKKLNDWALSHAHGQRKTLGEFFMELVKEYKKDSKRDSKRK